MMLSCSLCHLEKEDKDFTRFARNPSLTDRDGYCIVCRECASSYVFNRGDTKASLRDILRLQDIPYIEKFADLALDLLDKKREITNVVIKKNVYDGVEEEAGIETNQIQNTLYTCYTGRLGLIPKKYINFSYSDGIRSDEPESEQTTKVDDTNNKEIQTAIRSLRKQFGEVIYNDKDRLAKAVKLKVDELGLHKNNNSKRQAKFRLRTYVMTLIDAGVLNKESYAFIYSDAENEVETEVKTEGEYELKEELYEIASQSDVDVNALQLKWGWEYKSSDLKKFEKKYNELVKNYEIKTASHEEFLKHACISSVRANECMAKNDVAGAKSWMSIFKDMTSAGKLQPQQMSKADLSGGLNNFSEFYKTVEQANNIIEIIPDIYESPRDKADFVIYCLVQYVRRLKGLPDIEYKEIYKFYEELESQFIDDDGDTIIDIEDFFSDIDGDV